MSSRSMRLADQYRRDLREQRDQARRSDLAERAWLAGRAEAHRLVRNTRRLSFRTECELRKDFRFLNWYWSRGKVPMVAPWKELKKALRMKSHRRPL